MEQATTVLLLVRRDTTTHEPFRALGTTVCEKREGSGFALVGGAYIYRERRGHGKAVTRVGRTQNDSRENMGEVIRERGRRSCGGIRVRHAHVKRATV
jgi:hypothetical protein